MTTSRRTLLKYSAGLAALSAMGRPAFAAAPTGPIRIGVLYDLSGPFAAAGSVASSIGAQIAIDLTNEKGGVLGKYKVEPVKGDSQSKADVAINEAERLIHQENCDIILGVYSSAHAVPLAEKLNQEKKILWITTAVATSVVKDKNLTYVFRATIHSDQYGEAGIKFLHENAKAKLGMDPKDVKIAIIHEDGPYGTGVSDADVAFAKELGMPVAIREAYSATAPDLSSLVTKLKRAGGDVIIHAGYNPDITLFLRQSREAGLRFKMLIGNGAGYSQIDKLRETFKTDVDDFCDIDPVAAQILNPKSLAPGMGDLIKIMVERYVQDERQQGHPAALLHGLQPDLAPAAERAAGRDREIRRRRSRGDPQGRPRRRHSARRHHPGLWRQVLSAGHAARRAERALDAGGDAVHSQHAADRGGVAHEHQDRRSRAAAAEVLALRHELRIFSGAGGIGR